MKKLILLLCICVTIDVAGQDNRDIFEKADRYLNAVDHRVSQLSQSYSKATNAWINKIAKAEAKFKRKLQRKYPEKYNQLSSTFSDSSYLKLAGKLNTYDSTQVLTTYNSDLDTLQSALNFLQSQSSVDPKKLVGIQQAIKELSSKINISSQLQKETERRKKQILEAVKGLPIGKELQRYSKQVYYYKQQLAEYKALLKDKKKLEQKLLIHLRESSAFKKFLSKHSWFNQLFPQQASDNALPVSFASLTGLQTRSSVQALVADRIGMQNQNAQAYLQQQFQQAQDQLSQLKNEIKNPLVGNGGLNMPDFKPNLQKTKSFLKRLEYGFNIRTQKARALRPAMSNMEMSLGYKLNEKSVIGFGVGYKLGLGFPVKNIQMSHEGISFRSFADIKMKGNIWFSGGIEYSYQKTFTSIGDNIDWQKSALTGISKKIMTPKKKGVKLQLYYDWLWRKGMEQAPVQYRIGWIW